MIPSPFHAFCIAAPHSGGGKTTVALALMRAFRNRGKNVQGFKCGPDYIDPSFHHKATGRPSYNIDTWMMGRKGVQTAWNRHASQADIAICEGVMGLFDSRQPGDMRGSTADCALTLDLPVFLVVQVRGMAGSLAPLIAGFRDFHPHLRLAGVIANGAGSRNHARILAETLQQEGLPPLVGALPSNPEWSLPERQLGLVPAEESNRLESWFETMGQAAEEWLDLDQIMALSQSVRPALTLADIPAGIHPGKKIGIAKDAAFRFYYEENLDYLVQTGWELVEFSPLRDRTLPDGLEIIYLGGGYPEIFAEELSKNTAMRNSIRDFAASGKHIFAECGGYMYLGQSLVTEQGRKYPMCGVINGTCRMGRQLRSLGYREISLVPGTLPWMPETTALRGHEFHWSDMELHEAYPPLYSFRDRTGTICSAGISTQNVRAGYIHLYWAHLPEASERNISFPRYSGRVLLLNGASSSGKTSLAHAFRKYSPCPVMIFSIDRFLPICGPNSQSVTQTVNDTRQPLIEAFHAGITASAKAGAFVVVDHVIGEQEEWLHDLLARLGSLTLKTVKVHCDRTTLINRETNRTDRIPDISHALSQSETIHRCMDYDLEIETTLATPDTCASQLLGKLSQYPGFLPVMEEEHGELHLQ